MRITNRLAALPQILFCATLALTSAQAQSTWHVERTIPIGGIGGADYLTVDPVTHFLYVPRSTHTLVIDATSGKTIADIPGQKTAHGVALVPKLNRGFISDGGGSVTIFDLKTNAVLGVLASAPDTDGILYDPGTDTILISAGDSNALVTFKPEIDPKSGKIDPLIQLGGAPEFLAADGEGKVYVNLEDKDTVAVVDLKSRSVVDRWSVAPGGAPVGMVMDLEHRTLFVGCRKPAKMIAISTATGKIVGDLPIGTGVDATGIIGSQAFASSGDGTLTVVDRASDKFTVAQTVKTTRGAKTLGIDTSTGKIYLPAFDLEEMKPGATGRPKAKPDTFKILVVSR